MYAFLTSNLKFEIAREKAPCWSPCGLVFGEFSNVNF
jgi:hypothetical protein